ALCSAESWGCVSGGPGGGIGRSEAVVQRLVGPMRLRVWVRQRLPSERASHGGCEIGKRARPDGGEECSPVGRPLLAVHRAHRKAEHVRLETADERTARTTARQQEMTGGEPQLLENRNGVAEREADAFQHGPGQMRAR